MNKRTYYTNGTKEVRLLPGQPIPEGWTKGRVKSTVTTQGAEWYTDGEANVLVMPGTKAPAGYRRGRTKTQLWIQRQSATLKNQRRHHYNNGCVELCLGEGEVIPEGFVPGRLPMSQEQKDKISCKHQGRPLPSEVVERIINTKLEKHTFNTSEPEKAFANALRCQYGKADIRTNYKSAEYPFRCDFYIISLNKYIELNLHWTHGFKPYDPSDPECQARLLEWQEKAKTSQFYQNAIETWTVRDVKKLQVARENNLNYEVIYKL